jgi:hypothetical protein
MSHAGFGPTVRPKKIKPPKYDFTSLVNRVREKGTKCIPRDALIATFHSMSEFEANQVRGVLQGEQVELFNRMRVINPVSLRPTWWNLKRKIFGPRHPTTADYALRLGVPHDHFVTVYGDMSWRIRDLFGI